jgi:hypothetical protein
MIFYRALLDLPVNARCTTTYKSPEVEAEHAHTTQILHSGPSLRTPRAPSLHFRCFVFHRPFSVLYHENNIAGGLFSRLIKDKVASTLQVAACQRTFPDLHRHINPTTRLTSNHRLWTTPPIRADHRTRGVSKSSGLSCHTFS